MSDKKLKIALIAPPWLSLYPGCVYGIENMVHHLAEGLTDQGHHVELFSVANTKSRVTKLHWYHKEDQYWHIHRPYWEATSILVSHLLYSLNIIRDDGNFDIIHDHNSFLGPSVLAYAADLPPALHTLHEPFTDDRKLAMGVPDNRHMFDQFKSIRSLYFNAVSHKQRSLAPKGLLPRIEEVIHNAVDSEEYIFRDKKEDYFIEVASVSPDKGQAVAAKACKELGLEFKIAGMIGGRISTPEELAAALKDSTFEEDRYFTYFREEVLPHLVPGRVEYVGRVSGAHQKDFYARAKAFLFPIDWEEPFGMSVLDSLASGTPVIALNRGSVPELIEHCINGFIANNYTEFKQYIKRVGEIDPAACRKTVEDKFSVEQMTQNYVSLYRQIIKRHGKLRMKRLINLDLKARLAYPQLYENPGWLSSYPKAKRVN